MRIIGYTYEADCHCVGCAKERASGTPVGHSVGPNAVKHAGFKLAASSLNAPDSEAIDEHGISIHAEDNEGNRIHPMFSTDEQLEPQYCGDCHERIK